MITRDLEETIRSKLPEKKVIIIFGARQVGKTTLLKTLFGEPNSSPDILWLNGDDSLSNNLLSDPSAVSLGNVVRGYKTVIIDEAQKIENIGLKLKILYDNYGEKIQFIATGSSSFDLLTKVNEPLTGRKFTFWLYPPSLNELVSKNKYPKEKSLLETRLLFGSYPAVVESETSEQKKDLLRELTEESLYKDVLNLTGIIKTDYLRKILQALAFQVGSQVNPSELASLVNLDRKTIDKYITLLEESYIIFRLPSFSKNLRNELKFSQKIYFYDNGIRNGLINDFRPLSLRSDSGQLFENYIASELKKKFPKDELYFWRTFDGAEIDFLVRTDGELRAFEVKYNPKKSAKLPASFEKTYSPKSFSLINSENYIETLQNNNSLS
ncbi:ATP-binding protein [Candidatus Saccharibacteria bacterium]|nr:ATP-binding protein [Candidatus Saccharibacteria bacterium]